MNASLTVTKTKRKKVTATSHALFKRQINEEKCFKKFLIATDENGK